MLSLTADNRENGLAASVVQMLFLFFRRETASGWSGSVLTAKTSCRYPRSLPRRRHLPALAPCMLVLHQPPASGETVGPPIPGKGGVPSQPTPSPMKAHGPVGEPLATQPMSLNFGNFSELGRSRRRPPQVPLRGNNRQWLSRRGEPCLGLSGGHLPRIA